MAAGTSKKNSSAPFFTGINNKNRSTVAKLISSKYQLFLKVLLTPKVSIDLKTADNKEIIKILQINKRYLKVL